MRYLQIILAVNLCAANVYTGQYDLARTGANTSETILTQASVAKGFTKLGAYSVVGKVWAQPLYASAITVSGVSRNVLIVATSENRVYAFDADKPGSAALWSLNLGFSYPSPDGDLYDGQVGITSTPVIDPSAKVLYFVSDDVNGTYTIHAVHLEDGADFHAATTISATVGSTTFVGTSQLQRPALLLLSGTVYVAFGSFADVGTWYGWILGYSATSLAQTQKYITTPTSNQAAIWMSGGGLASDGTNIWGVTGNDSGTCVPSNYPESFISLNASLSVTDYMTPANCATLDSLDKDTGSSRAIVAGNYILGGGKDGTFWVLNKGAMGSNQGSGPPIAQSWTPGAGIFNSYAFANGTLFMIPGAFSARSLNAYSCPNTCNTTPTASSSATFNWSSVAYTSNGSTAGTGIVWAITSTEPSNGTLAPGTFYAFNADTMSVIFSDATMGTNPKFTMPTIVNGNAYVPNFDGKVNVYGFIGGFVRSGAGVTH